MRRYTRENTMRITASETGSVRITCALPDAPITGDKIEVEAFWELRAATVEDVRFADHEATIYARID